MIEASDGNDVQNELTPEQSKVMVEFASQYVTNMAKSQAQIEKKVST